MKARRTYITPKNDMNRNKHEKLRDLEEEIASKRKQPIYSDEETRKLEEAERLVARAAEIAEQSKIDKEGDPLRLFEDQAVAELHGNDLGLTLTEFELLSVLKRHSPKAFTRQQLLEEVFQDAMMVTERTVDAHIKNLREKLGRYKDCIQTVRGVGYRYE